jgi:hypothetical protein
MSPIILPFPAVDIYGRIPTLIGFLESSEACPLAFLHRAVIEVSII